MPDTRQSLAFRERAEAAFAFLRDAFGFHLVHADDTLLRYESDQVFVNVYHGRSSYSIRFEIGLLSASEVRYYPEEVAALKAASDEVFFQAGTPDRVRLYSQALADVLRRYGRDLLTGDTAEFARLQEVRDRQATATTRRYSLSALRQRAATAWKRRDYAAVVEALNAIDHDMSPAEQRKLQYAREKLGRIQ